MFTDCVVECFSFVDLRSEVKRARTSSVCMFVCACCQVSWGNVTSKVGLAVSNVCVRIQSPLTSLHCQSCPRAWVVVVGIANVLFRTLDFLLLKQISLFAKGDVSFVNSDLCPSHLPLDRVPRASQTG